jgi:hypothetical protein
MWCGVLQDVLDSGPRSVIDCRHLFRSYLGIFGTWVYLVRVGQVTLCCCLSAEK